MAILLNGYNALDGTKKGGTGEHNSPLLIRIVTTHLLCVSSAGYSSDFKILHAMILAIISVMKLFSTSRTLSSSNFKFHRNQFNRTVILSLEWSIMVCISDL